MHELRYLRLGNQIDGDGASEILTSERLGHIIVLDLHGNTIRDLDTDALRTAALPNLRVLNLASANNYPMFGQKKGLAGADVRGLARSPITHRLWILDLTSNGLTDSMIASASRSVQMMQLTTLNLGFNTNLGPAGAEAIAACDRLANLQALRLTGTKIGNAGAKALAKSKYLGKLRHLDVGQAGVNVSGLSALRKRFGESAVRA
jgi:hypothetical protein